MDYKRKTLLEENLKKIVATLKERYKPEKIILFGSLVSGNISSNSDIDLLIIKKTKLKFYDRLREVAELCDYNVGADLLVYTPSEFAEEIKTNIFLRGEIIEKGRVIYDCAA